LSPASISSSPFKTNLIRLVRKPGEGLPALTILQPINDDRVGRVQLQDDIEARHDGKPKPGILEPIAAVALETTGREARSTKTRAMGDELSFSISFPLDNDGFLRRQCPACRRDFKWFPAEEGDPEPEEATPALTAANGRQGRPVATMNCQPRARDRLCPSAGGPTWPHSTKRRPQRARRSPAPPSGASVAPRPAARRQAPNNPGSRAEPSMAAVRRTAVSR
jgi:hypothetical protein